MCESEFDRLRRRQEYLARVKAERFWKLCEEGKYDDLIDRWVQAVNDIVGLAGEIQEKVGKENIETFIAYIGWTESLAYADMLENSLMLHQKWKEMEEQQNE